MSMTTEIEYVILESEYNVLMALMKSYEKEYVMEFYYMEAGFKDNIQKAGNAVAQGVSNVGQKMDQGFDNAIQKGNAAVDKFGQKISNAANNSNGSFTQNLSNKIENGINKLLGWCKKASNFVVLNTKKIPPETQVQAPPQTQQLQQEVQKYTQVNQRAVQALSQPDNQQNEQEFKQIAAELVEIEKKMKALQIKKTLLEKQQRELSQSQQPQNQQLPPLKFNRPQQQTPQPQSQQTPQPQQPQNQTPTQQPTQQDGFVTIKAGDFQAMIKQIQEQQKKIDQSVNQSLQQANQAANNAQTATSSARQQLMNQSVKTQATILNDCVEITKDMKQQVQASKQQEQAQQNQNDAATLGNADAISGAQLFDLINNNLAQNGHRRTWNVKTQLLEFSTTGSFISDSAGNVYPYATEPYQVRVNTLNPQLFDVVGKGGLDDSTLIIPAKFNDHGDLISKGAIRQGAGATLTQTNGTQPTQNNPQQTQQNPTPEQQAQNGQPQPTPQPNAANNNNNGMPATQVINLVNDWLNKGGAAGYQRRVYNVGTKRTEFILNPDKNSGYYACDTRDGSVYPVIKQIPIKSSLYSAALFDMRTRRIDDDTPITPAKIDQEGNVVQKGVIG